MDRSKDTTGPSEQIGQGRVLLFAMVSLQAAWLVMRWYLGGCQLWNRFQPISPTRSVWGVVVWMPDRFVFTIRRASASLVERERKLAWVGCGSAFGAGAIYVFAQGRVSPDEAQCFAVAQLVATEGTATLLSDYAEVPWLRRQHPTLVPMLYGLAMRLLWVDLSTGRLVSLLFGVGNNCGDV